jgi:cysteine desulfurase/selenocysteine lyase
MPIRSSPNCTQASANLGIQTLAPEQAESPSGIVAFTHANTQAIHDALLAQNIHVMHQVGRIRLAVHGYNTAQDIDAVLETLAKTV